MDIVTLRPVGFGRYIDGVFLAVWITFWCVFEVFGLALLASVVGGIVASVLGLTIPWASRVPSAAATTFGLVFILFWLSLWTVGGIAAITHFLRSIAGRDSITVSSAGLLIERRAGPFRRQRLIPRDTLWRVRYAKGDATIVVDTAKGVVDITHLGTRDDRAALLVWLRQRLTLPEESQVRRLEAETLPTGWQIEEQGAGVRLMRIARLETWGASQWHVTRGRVVWRRRFWTWEREVTFEHAALEIDHARDSDGDDRYSLRIRSVAGARTIPAQPYDDAEVAALGAWLSARTGFPFARGGQPVHPTQGGT